jgi:glycosyltransferase involved in cell wall biosynthesis
MIWKSNFMHKGRKNMIAYTTDEVETGDSRAGRPKITVGMPVFNSQEYLSPAIDAILDQTTGDFEIIIADNASTDRTREICLAYQAKDTRIRYIRFDEGWSVARTYNRLVELARGVYFKWAAPDDLIAPAFLERCAEVLDQEPDVVVCYPRTRLIDELGRVLGTYADELNLRSPQPHQRLRGFYQNQGLCHPVYGLIRVNALRQSGLLGEFPMADRVLISELALKGQIHELPAYLFLRRIHPGFSARVNAVDIDFPKWKNFHRSGKVQFPKWQRFAGYMKGIWRAELRTAETFRCYIQLAQYIFIPKRLTGLLTEAASLLTPRPTSLRRAGRSSTK